MWLDRLLSHQISAILGRSHSSLHRGQSATENLPYSLPKQGEPG